MPDTSFTAQVTISGDADVGNMTIAITQLTMPERPPIEPPVEPPVEPPIEPPPVWAPPVYLRTDTERVSVPNVPRPGYLTSFTDPNFHTKITRVTGDPGSAITGISGARWGDQARHHYNSDQAWNCDETMIYLDTNKGSGAAGVSKVFLDGESYQPLFGPKNQPSSADIRWHETDPSLMLFAAGNKLGTWNPKTGTQTTIETFSGFSDLTFGPWEGSASRDGKLVVLTSASRREAFVYDIGLAKKYPTLSCRYGTFSDCRISRGGSFMVWKVDPDEVVITDFDGNIVHKLPNNYVSHFDVAVDAAGEEVVCGRVNSSSAGQGASGLVSKYRLRDGQRTGLQIAKGWSSHTSCRSNTNYCVAGPTLEGGDYVYNGELIMCDMNGGMVYRLGHSHTTKELDYVAQVQPSHSPNGGRVIFASTWGGSGPTPRPVGCYVIDFRT